MGTMTRYEPLPRRNVCLDFGHGGRDPGAVSRQNPPILEKDLNLAMGLTLKGALERLGIASTLTRSNDTFVELSERPLIAKRAFSAALISIHHDVATAPGPGAYHNDLPASKDLAQRLVDGLGGGWVRSHRASRFGGLTVLAGFDGPAVLLEFGPTALVPRTLRIERANAVAPIIAKFLETS